MEENINNEIIENEIKTDINNELQDEVTENAPIENEPECGCTTDKRDCRCKGHLCMIILMVILFLAVAALYALHFCGNKLKVADADGSEVSVVVSDGQSLRIAYVNTDTLMAHYEYALELQRKIEQVSAQQAALAQQEEQFQADYQNFLQTGENLTLSQQQEKERELKERYEKLARLEKQYADLLPQKQKHLQEELDKMTRAVYNFIADYNSKHDKYNLILSKCYSNTPVLYGDKALDITNEILEGLNKEYAQVKKIKQNK